MTTRILLPLLAACLMATGLAWADEATKGHPDSSAWADLFAADLSGTIRPEGVWTFTDGVLTATEDQCLWTEKQYDNFVVDLEFKTAPGTNSGVIVYVSDVKNWIPNSVEIQIADQFSDKWTEAPASWHCGAVFGHLPPKKQVVKRPGEWNRMTVTCRGPIIQVVINGELVNEMDMRQWTSAKENPDGSSIPPWLSRPKAELATKGHVGLQGKHAGAPIYFRNLKIKELE
ncbi:MAG: DUF1080 domain-containing protein [Patescibacteria group bacterium]|nr:DUF1080 domain-containing protein [Patescibacteria group bacterium]